MVGRDPHLNGGSERRWGSMLQTQSADFVRRENLSLDPAGPEAEIFCMASRLLTPTYVANKMYLLVPM